MNSDKIYTEKLFSYGTLRYEAVQLATFGRKLIGKPDTLLGFKLKYLDVKDPKVIAMSGEASHPIIGYTGYQRDQIVGMVFDISLKELKQADLYEVAEYKRIPVQLASGLNSWVYVSTVSAAVMLD